MKKGILTILLTFLILVLCSSIVQAKLTKIYYDGQWHDYNDTEIKLNINGQYITGEMPPIIFDEYSLVPAREVFEALGAEVAWNNIIKSVNISYDSTRIILKINSDVAKVNNEDKKLDIPARIINSKTMIPARFVSEALGFDVQWDEENKTIFIKNRPKTLNINNIRYLNNPEEYIDNDGTLSNKVQIDISGNNEIKDFTTMYLQNPDRLVIDIKDGILDITEKTIPIGENKISQIRTSQYSSQPNVTRVVIDLNKKLDYNVGLSKDKKHILVILPLNANASGDGKYVVVIDPGHGGKEPGATYSGICEKSINLSIALKLQNLLLDEGITVYMTRDDDTSVGLYERSDLANEKNADLLISIHNNAMEDTSFDGTMTLYYPDDNGVNEKVAGIIQSEVVKGLGITSRGVRKRTDLAVLRTSIVPAALVEVAFMTNKDDMNNLKQDTFLNKAAVGLKNGVMKVLDSK